MKAEVSFRFREIQKSLKATSDVLVFCNCLDARVLRSRDQVFTKRRANLPKSRLDPWSGRVTVENGTVSSVPAVEAGFTNVTKRHPEDDVAAGRRRAESKTP